MEPIAIEAPPAIRAQAATFISDGTAQPASEEGTLPADGSLPHVGPDMTDTEIAYVNTLRNRDGVRHLVYRTLGTAVHTRNMTPHPDPKFSLLSGIYES